MTGFMFVLFVAMFIGIILMFIIDVHMAQMIDMLETHNIRVDSQIRTLDKLTKHWIKSMDYGSIIAELKMYRNCTKWFQQIIEKYYTNALDQYEKKQIKKISKELSKELNEK